jgi:hypothetical protein
VAQAQSGRTESASGLDFALIVHAAFICAPVCRWPVPLGNLVGPPHHQASIAMKSLNHAGDLPVVGSGRPSCHETTSRIFTGGRTFSRCFGLADEPTVLHVIEVPIDH